MDPFLAHAQSKQDDCIRLIRELVECESPSDSPEAVNRFVDLLSERLSPIGTISLLDGGRFGRHLRCEFNLGLGPKDGQVLLLGHSDTVWPLGTLRSMPFRQSEGRLFGPGVLDMKAGIAFCIVAMQALRDLELPVGRRLVLLINSDEEVGSESSRQITEAEAARSAAVLVLEPGTGLEGKLKTARKGVGDYTIVVRGKAAHAGLDFTSGASAILELARQIEKISTFTQLERGITVNPGVISGGTRTNVVAAEARIEVDTRVLKMRDAGALDRKFRGLKPFDRRCAVEVLGGLNRPPMERSAGGVRLFKLARKLAAELGVDLDESTSGGGSDGNFTAGLGIPTLDGLGAVGEGAHAAHESILIERMADRIALLAKILKAL